MMSTANNALLIAREGRLIRIAGAGPQEQYRALRFYGISDIVAQAVAARLVTVRVRA